MTSLDMLSILKEEPGVTDVWLFSTGPNYSYSKAENWTCHIKFANGDVGVDAKSNGTTAQEAFEKALAAYRKVTSKGTLDLLTAPAPDKPHIKPDDDLPF